MRKETQNLATVMMIVGMVTAIVAANIPYGRLSLPIKGISLCAFIESALASHAYCMATIKEKLDEEDQ